MAFSIDTYNLNQIRTYAQAKEFCESVKPVKTRDRGTYYPLAVRGHQHKRIEKIKQRDGSEAYEMCLYATAMVTYHSDGSVLVKTFNSVSSHAFIWCVLPSGLQPYSHQGKMMIRAETEDGPAWYSDRTLLMNPHKTLPGRWALAHGPQPRFRQVLDKKKAAEIRKAAKPFLDWTYTTRQITGLKLLSRSHEYSPRETFPCALEELNDPSKWPGFESVLLDDPAPWRRKIYLKFGALQEVQISPLEPPKKGIEWRYS